MNQADGAAGDAAGQILGGSNVAGVIIVGPKSFGHSREVNYGIYTGESVFESLVPRKITRELLDCRGQAARQGSRPRETSYGLGGFRELFQQVTADKPGSSR